MSIFYIDGEFVDASNATLPATDLSILRGYGVFDFTRTYGGVPFRLSAHLRRLQRSAALIELDCPWDIEELAEIALETLRRNSFVEAGIRLVVTGGESANGFLPSGKSRLLVMATPLDGLPRSAYAQGARVATVEQTRNLPEAKTINYIPGITAQITARRRAPDAIEAIYVVDGKAVEGTRSNIFILAGGGWITPEADLLPGITRAEVIELLGGEDAVDMRDITLEELYAADEAIITSSTKEVVPIVKVDEATIGAGVPGEHTKRLMRCWREMTEAFASAGMVM